MNYTPPSKLATVGIFLIAMIGMTALVLIADFFVESFFNFSFLEKGGAFGIFVIMYAASLAGQFYFSRAKAAPSSGTSWLLAFYFALANTIFSVAVFSSLIVALDLNGTPLQELKYEFERPGFVSDQLPLLLGVLAGIILLLTLVTRLGFGMGIRNARKAFERKQALKVNEFK